MSTEQRTMRTRGDSGSGWCGRGVALAALMLAATPSQSQEGARAQELVDDALATFNSFVANPDMEWFRDHVGQSQGIMIVPEKGQGGFLIGAKGGSGVLLKRDAASGEWSYPSFVGLGAVTFGFQIGGQVAEVILLIMTERGMEAMSGSNFSLGTGFGIAAGPVGGGTQAATSDVLSFTRARGAFGGVTVSGAGVEEVSDRNAAFYGRPVTGREILAGGVSNAGADRLRTALASVAGGSAMVIEAFDVAVIQRALKARGYDPGVVDGIHGPNTAQAIRQFQSASGLEVTGLPSAELQSRLTTN